MSNDRIIIERIIDQKKNGTAPELLDSTFFEIFSASEILKDYDLSYEEIDSGNIGAGGDGGIDSMYMFLNGELIREDTEYDEIRKKNLIELYLIQSKKTNGFDEAALDRFRSSAEALFDLSTGLSQLESVYNAELIATVRRFRKCYIAVLGTFPDISFNYKFVTLGDQVHPNTERKVPQLETSIKKLFDNADFSFEFIGARKLLQLARKEPVSNFRLEFAENPISTEGGSYVCLVPISKYFKFIVDENKKLIKRIFDENVRDYQGNVKVNQAIQDTLQSPGNEDFWFLNNGVTVVCPRASTSGKTLLIEDPQIVNGLQTSYEIYSYFKQFDEPPDDQRKLLVRVLEEKDTEARDNIVQATNSQTTLPSASLRAGDKIQRDIEDFFFSKAYYYERRKNYYKNAGKPLNRIISISYLSQAVISILLQKPDFARARPSTLINKDEDYIKIFNEQYPIEIYLISVQVMKKVDDFLRSHSDHFDLTRKDINNIKFHIAMAVSMQLMKKVDNIKVSDIGCIDIEAVDSMLSEVTLEVIGIFKHLGAIDQVAKNPTFVGMVLDSCRSKMEQAEQGAEPDKQ